MKMGIRGIERLKWENVPKEEKRNRSHLLGYLSRGGWMLSPSSTCLFRIKLFKRQVTLML